VEINKFKLDSGHDILWLSTETLQSYNLKSSSIEVVFNDLAMWNTLNTYMMHENNKNAKYEAKKGPMEDSETA
jgi:hypothetical protein